MYSTLTSDRKRCIMSFLSFFMISISLLLRFTSGKDLSSIILFAALFLILISESEISINLKLYGILNFIISTIIGYYIFRNDITVFSDSSLYIDWILELSKMPVVNVNVISSLVKSLHIGYEVINYNIYMFFQSFMALHMFNIFLSSFSYLLFHRLIRKTFNWTIANYAFVFLNSSVYLKVFTTSILKDALVLFLCIASIVVYKELVDKGSLMQFITLGILMVLLLMTRIYAAVGIIGGIGLDYVVNMKNKRYLIWMILACYLGFVALFVLGPFNSYFKLMLNFLKKIPLNITTFLELIKFSISFILSPFAWNMGQEMSAYTILIVDSTLFLILLPLFIIGVMYIFMNKETRKKMYLYIVPIIIHIFALGSKYKTGGVRQRIGVYPFIVLIYIIGFYVLYKVVREQRVDL